MIKPSGVLFSGFWWHMDSRQDSRDVLLILIPAARLCYEKESCAVHSLKQIAENG